MHVLGTTRGGDGLESVPSIIDQLLLDLPGHEPARAVRHLGQYVGHRQPGMQACRQFHGLIERGVPVFEWIDVDQNSPEQPHA